MNSIQVGDLILTKDKRSFLVTKTTPSFTKTEFTENGKIRNKTFFAPEIHLFDIDNKKGGACSSENLNNDELWAGIGIKKIIKNNNYSLDIKFNRSELL